MTASEVPSTTILGATMATGNTLLAKLEATVADSVVIGKPSPLKIQVKTASSPESLQESVLTTSGLVAPKKAVAGPGHQEMPSKTAKHNGHTLEVLVVLSLTTVKAEVRTAWPSSTTSTKTELNGTMLAVATPNPSSASAKLFYLNYITTISQILYSTNKCMFTYFSIYFNLILYNILYTVYQYYS